MCAIYINILIPMLVMVTYGTCDTRYKFSNVPGPNCSSDALIFVRVNSVHVDASSVYASHVSKPSSTPPVAVCPIINKQVSSLF